MGRMLFQRRLLATSLRSLVLVVISCIVGGSVLALAQAKVSTVPPNASPSPYGGFVCDEGYVKRVRSCVHVTDATDSEVRRLMMAMSLASYPGNCPCPYNTDRAGRRCGGRSAYSRPGGASPICYESDIAAASVKRFRERHARKGG